MDEIWMIAAFSTPIALFGCKLAALFRRGRRALVRRAGAILFDAKNFTTKSSFHFCKPALPGEEERGNTVHPKVFHHLLLSDRVKVPQLALLVARIVDHKVETGLANQLFEL